MTKESSFPFVELPKLWEKSPVVKLLYPESRWYVERGSTINFRHWFREAHQAWGGDLVPFQWVPDFVGVSRSAAHQRAKRGGLTIVSYILTTETKTILGTRKERDTRTHYDYAFISECQAWEKILLERVQAASLGLNARQRFDLAHNLDKVAKEEEREARKRHKRKTEKGGE